MIEDLTALVPQILKYGKCDAGMGGSTTTIVSADFIGFGDDYFNNKFYIQITKNANSVGNAPERQIRQVTDYTSISGTLVCTDFTVNVEENDEFLLIHEGIERLAGKTEGSTTYDRTTDSCEAIRDAITALRTNAYLTAEYTAQGNIAKGDLVGITAGGLATTIYDNPSVSPSAIAAVQEIADAVTFSNPIVVFLSATKQVVVWEDSADGKVYVNVGNVDAAGAMTWGAKQDTGLPATVADSIHACACGALKIAISYALAADGDGYVAICTFDGSDVVTAGAPSEFRDADTINCTSVCSPATDVIIVAASGVTADKALVLRAATIDTTTPTWGAVVEKDTTVDGAFTIDIKALSSSVAACGFIRTDSLGICFVMTLAGNTLTVGEMSNGFTTIGSNVACHLNVFIPSAGYLVVIYRTTTNTIFGANATTYSGTTITNFPTEVTKITPATGPYTRAIMYATNEFCVATFSVNTFTNLYFVSFSPTNRMFWHEGTTALATTHSTTQTGFGNYSSQKVNFVVACIGTAGDGYAIHGSILGINEVYAWTSAYFTETTQFLGVAEEAITHAASGTICVYGIPVSSTKTAMDLAKAWYWRDSPIRNVVIDTRIGDSGMVAYPINAVEMFINPIETGAFNAVTGKIVEASSSSTADIVNVSSSATANTFGAWTQTNAYVAKESLIESITIASPVTADTNSVLSLGVGVAANEMTIIRISFRNYWVSAAGLFSALIFTPNNPIKVTEGVRIAARMSDSIAGAIAYGIGVQLYQA